MKATTIYYDARSLSSKRVTGWERFSKQLYLELTKCDSKDVSLRTMNSTGRSTIPSVLSDIKSVSKLGSLRHYPTIPPLVANSKTLLTVHDSTWWKYPEYSSKLGGTLLKRLAENAVDNGAKLVTVSQTSKLDLQEIFSLEDGQVEVIYPGLTKLPLSDNLVHPNSLRPYLLFVGTLEPRKDLGTLISAYSLAKISADVDLVLVGRVGWNTSVPKGIKYVGAVSDHELSNWIANAEALIIPSVYEGFGLPIIEAFSLGCPVIASNIPVFREVSSGLAALFEVQQADDLAIKIKSCLDSTVDTRRLVSRAADFSWSKAADQYMSLYQKVNRAGL